MTRHHSVLSSLALALILPVVTAAGAAAQSLLAIEKATITIAGSSNIHDWSAATSDATITRVEFGSNVPGASFWDEVQKPGGLAAFDLAIKAESLKSSKDGLDKNMYKALKTKDHPVITFRLTRMDGIPGALEATGLLKIAGVEREVTLPLKTVRKGDLLAVSGEIAVLMTDYGIEPPKAMMGMVKADPKVTVTFDVQLRTASTN
jgi:hypothetical protein